jgi:hypothetical protein
MHLTLGNCDIIYVAIFDTLGIKPNMPYIYLMFSLGFSPYLKKQVASRTGPLLGPKAEQPSRLDRELGHPATVVSFLPYPSRGRGQRRWLAHGAAFVWTPQVAARGPDFSQIG